VRRFNRDVVTDNNEEETEDDFGDFAGFEAGDGESNVNLATVRLNKPTYVAFHPHQLML
jgi:hypothetical protein